MPWCPLCKNEYREGITKCADCGCDLVDSLEEIRELRPLAYIKDEELAGKLVKYLDYSKIPAECSFDEERDAFAVLVDEDNLKKAKTAYEGFYRVETANELSGKIEAAMARKAGAAGEGYKFEVEGDLDVEPGEEYEASEEMDSEEEGFYDPADEGFEAEEAEVSAEGDDAANDRTYTDEELRELALEEIVYKPAGVYVKKSDESKEMFSTAITFIVFGALLLVFMILNAVGILNIFAGTFSLVVIGVLSIGCLGVGINAISRAKRAGAQSVEEEKLTKAINGHLDSVVTEEFLASCDDPSLSPELNYLRRTEAIKKSLTDTFGELDDTYIDSLIEDYYNTHIDAE
ncbi:MAG: hypothetical protein ILP10_07055 [Lachnospiraceae bacterium]|nr:hypothetical protein [Lachnospiraceae bacterium]